MLVSEITILDSYLKNIFLNSDESFYGQIIGKAKNVDEVFSKFLRGLNEIIIYDSRIDLIEYLKAYNIQRPDILSNIIHRFIPDYIETLAEEHLNGNPTKASEYLLATNNQQFLESLSFLKDLESVFLIEGRSTLKNHLQSLDKLDQLDISEEEMFNAFNAIEEREEIKKRLKSSKSVPINTSLPVFANHSDERINVSKSEEGEVFMNATTSRTSFMRYMSYAVAATFIGVGLFFGYKWLKNRPEDEIVKNGDKPKTDSSLFSVLAADTAILGFNTDKDKKFAKSEDEFTLPELTSRIFQDNGYTIEFYNVAKYRDSLLRISEDIRSEINKSSGGTGNLEKIKAEVDLKLNSLKPGYLFNKNQMQIKIYLNKEAISIKVNETFPKGKRDDNTLEVQLIIDNETYKIKNTEILLPFIKDENF
jgi:hypothetical protein